MQQSLLAAVAESRGQNEMLMLQAATQPLTENIVSKIKTYMSNTNSDEVNKAYAIFLEHLADRMHALHGPAIVSAGTTTPGGSSSFLKHNVLGALKQAMKGVVGKAHASLGSVDESSPVSHSNNAAAGSSGNSNSINSNSPVGASTFDPILAELAAIVDSHNSSCPITPGNTTYGSSGNTNESILMGQVPLAGMEDGCFPVPLQVHHGSAHAPSYFPDVRIKPHVLVFGPESVVPLPTEVVDKDTFKKTSSRRKSSRKSTAAGTGTSRKKVQSSKPMGDRKSSRRHLVASELSNNGPTSPVVLASKATPPVIVSSAGAASSRNDPDLSIALNSALRKPNSLYSDDNSNNTSNSNSNNGGGSETGNKRPQELMPCPLHRELQMSFTVSHVGGVTGISLPTSQQQRVSMAVGQQAKSPSSSGNGSFFGATGTGSTSGAASTVSGGNNSAMGMSPGLQGHVQNMQSRPGFASVTIRPLQAFVDGDSCYLSVSPTSAVLRKGESLEVKVSLHLARPQTKVEALIVVEVAGGPRVLLMVKALAEKAVYGVRMSDVNMVPSAGYSNIPAPLDTLRERLLANNASLLKEEGIFRLAPGADDVAKFKKMLNEGCYNGGSNAITTAHLVKVWLREMPQRLFSSIPKEALQMAASETECVALIERFVPPAYQEIIWWVVDLLIETTERERFNRMNPVALSVCVGPNLFEADDSPFSNPLEAILISQRAVNVLYRLLINRKMDWDIENPLEGAEREANLVRPAPRTIVTKDGNINNKNNLVLPPVTDALPPLERIGSTRGAIPSLSRPGGGNRNQRLGGWMLKELAALLPASSTDDAPAVAGSVPDVTNAKPEETAAEIAEALAKSQIFDLVDVAADPSEEEEDDEDTDDDDTDDEDDEDDDDDDDLTEDEEEDDDRWSEDEESTTKPSITITPTVANANITNIPPPPPLLVFTPPPPPSN